MYDLDHREPTQALLAAPSRLLPGGVALGQSTQRHNSNRLIAGDRSWTRLKDDSQTALSKAPLLQEHPCYITPDLSTPVATHISSVGESSDLGGNEGCKSMGTKAYRRTWRDSEAHNI